MDADRVRDALAVAVRETMETMFFSEVAGAADPALLDGELFCAEIQFDGCRQGTFRLAMPLQTADEFASCLLGPDDAEPDPGAAVGEIANIVCGATLSHLFADGHINLSSPRLGACGAGDAGAERSIFQVDAGVLAAELVWRT